MYTKMLIATDGSDLAQRAVDHGLSLAKQLGCTVTVLTVSEPFPIMVSASSPELVMLPDDVDRFRANQAQHASDILNASKAAGEKMGLTVDTLHVADRQPAGAITEVAETGGFNLIVMGSHGRRGLGRLLLGSQTAEVLAHTKIPALIIR